MKQNLDVVNQRLDAVDHKLSKLDDNVTTLKFTQDHMSDKLDGIEVTMKYNDYHLKHDIKKMREDVDTITQILKIHEMLPFVKSGIKAGSL